MIGFEEGDVCNRDDCTGVMEIRVEGCTCFICPPCWACMNGLICTECGIRSGPDGDVPNDSKRGEYDDY